MELNFNSVETIVNLNASAAFQIDSGKVFKEDTDIVTFIIGEREFDENKSLVISCYSKMEELITSD